LDDHRQRDRRDRGRIAWALPHRGSNGRTLVRRSGSRRNPRCCVVTGPEQHTAASAGPVTGACLQAHDGAGGPRALGFAAGGRIIAADRADAGRTETGPLDRRVLWSLRCGRFATMLRRSILASVWPVGAKTMRTRLLRQPAVCGDEVVRGDAGVRWWISAETRRAPVRSVKVEDDWKLGIGKPAHQINLKHPAALSVWIGEHPTKMSIEQQRGRNVKAARTPANGACVFRPKEPNARSRGRPGRDPRERSPREQPG
jgi:hypothetical protein